MSESEIKKSRFQNFLTALFGWRRAPEGSEGKEQMSGLEMISVDLDSKERLVQAIAKDALSSKKLSGRLSELFQNWLTDNSDNIQEIAERRNRVDQLSYAKLNDPFILRAVQLYADEATQLDVQDRIISIESPDPKMSKKMYELLNQWGITQQRIRTTIEQLATYGDAFWANKITENGVERVNPMKQLQVSDRLEFNPMDALEEKKRKEGFFTNLSNRNELIKQMLEDLEESEDFADMFDTKLIGFTVENDMVVPPWGITHFRVNADASEFYPFGTSPILGTLAPFKLTTSTITLQSIARILSFPVTLYKVKTSPNTDEARQMQVVNKVREEYDNVGVNPQAGNSEVYTVNTKIWMPDGLLDVEIVKPDTDIGFTEDIEMYQDRTAVASGVPKAYLVQEWGGFGNSALSLTEQYKPFARANFSLQSAFLEGLSDLFRLHFAITGEYEFRTPFTISLRFPAEEASDEKNRSRSDSLSLTSEVLDLIRMAIGAEEDEGLPPDIIRDVLGKYSFLDPEDIMKWTRTARKSTLSKSSLGTGSDLGGFDFGGSGGEDFDFDDSSDEDFDFDDSSDEDFDLGGDDSPVEESLAFKKKRLRELSSRYKETKDEIYLRVLRENNIQEFVRNKRHVYASFNIPSQNEAFLEAIVNQHDPKKKRIKEKTLTDLLRQVKEENSTN